MITVLQNTTSAKISSALIKARRAQGSPAMGMVMTMVIVCSEAESAGAIESAITAGREHPARILVAVAGNGRKTELDAELRIGEGSPGEIVVLRMRGQMSTQGASVVRPLLLADSPVVVWWPGTAPAALADHELGRLATRRVTDAMGSKRPQQALRLRAENYRPGDTDLTWTRITPWRSLLAAAVDQYPATILSASVTAERKSAAASLLVAWLASRLHVPVTLKISNGPGITAATLTTPAGDIAIERPDGKLATYMVPGQPRRLVALKRRPVADLMAEELRRMDPDDVFHATLQALLADTASTATKKTVRKAPAKAASGGPVKQAAAKQAPAKKTASKKAASKKAAATAQATKSGAKKTSAKKTAAKKTTAKKTTARS